MKEALFPLYSLPPSADDEWQEITLASEPSEPFSHKILIKFLQLKLDLEVEPIFASLALYDAKEKKKVRCLKIQKLRMMWNISTVQTVCLLLIKIIFTDV